jgi:hypothetical protein
MQLSVGLNDEGEYIERMNIALKNAKPASNSRILSVVNAASATLYSL